MFIVLSQQEGWAWGIANQSSKLQAAVTSPTSTFLKMLTFPLVCAATPHVYLPRRQKGGHRSRSTS